MAFVYLVILLQGFGLGRFLQSLVPRCFLDKAEKALALCLVASGLEHRWVRVCNTVTEAEEGERCS